MEIESEVESESETGSVSEVETDSYDKTKSTCNKDCEFDDEIEAYDKETG